MEKNRGKISFVIPCYKSERTIRQVVEEIRSVCESNGIDHEIIAVCDCSPDNVFAVLEALVAEGVVSKAVLLAKNAGKNNAVLAGLREASGSLFVVLDDDGQCPVDSGLLNLIKPVAQGISDASYAAYPKKKQSALKNFGSSLNGLMAEKIIGKPNGLQISNFVAFNLLVKEQIVKYEGPYVYLSGLILRATSRVVNIEMEERKRLSGSTTFTISSMIDLLMSGFTSFSILPVLLLPIFGSALSLVLATLVVVLGLLPGAIEHCGYILLLSVLLLVAVLFASMLVIGEYVGRSYMCLTGMPQYVVRFVCSKP